MTKVLIISPSRKRKGGVASFIDVIYPHLDRCHLFELPGSQTIAEQIANFFMNQSRLLFHMGETYDLIHINPSLDLYSFIRDGLFVLQSKIRRKKVLVFFHGWRDAFARTIEKRFFFYFSLTFGNADYFLVLCSDFKRKLIEWGIEDQKIQIVTTAFDGTLIKDFRIDDKIREIKRSNTFRILFLARLHREKGIFETIEGVRILLEKGVPIKLDIAGDGPAYREVEKLLMGLNFGNAVSMLGHVDGPEKTKVFQNSHIYCLPSYREGMPLSLLEAMAFGLPAIVSPAGGIKDFFVNGKMGVLLKSIQPEEIAASIEKLVENKDKLLEVAMFNSRYALDHFSAPKVARSLTKIYEKVLEI